MSWTRDTATLQTRNTRHCYFESDKFSYCWQPQEFPYDECSRSSVEVTITTLNMGTAGIMMRADTSAGAANVHLEVNTSGEVLLFSRAEKDQSTSYKRLGKQSLPVTLRLTRNGNAFTGAFKSADGKRQWLDSGTVFSRIGAHQLIGFYGCSGSESERPSDAAVGPLMSARFTDWQSDYTENFISPEQHFKYPDAISKEILASENFDDGSLSNPPERPFNPLWKGIEYAYLPYDTAGGRYWAKSGSGFYTIGDDQWGDYELSLAFAAQEKHQNFGNLEFRLRYCTSVLYPQMDQYFSVVIKEGNRFSFEKHRAGNIQLVKSLQVDELNDGRFHHLKVQLLDQSYQVFIDGRLLAAGKDTLQPITMGKVAFQFQNAAVKLDDVIVRSIPDPVNGVMDNLLQNYFSRPIPEYLKKYGISHLPSLR
ncbi:hypothetical protein LL912_20855 [Niabella sp. CC-SYL272]|uniref:hypothetical protein n=1 Tax=Niabella agricola TaxID=2891571 RepID=UPI001F31ED04|nr:hypothetical protein [Niabella agricola]MCF3111249.1 hypothetical protein [Niabella agricola]